MQWEKGYRIKTGLNDSITLKVPDFKSRNLHPLPAFSPKRRRYRHDVGTSRPHPIVTISIPIFVKGNTSHIGQVPVICPKCAIYSQIKFGRTSLLLISIMDIQKTSPVSCIIWNWLAFYMELFFPDLCLKRRIFHLGSCTSDIKTPKTRFYTNGKSTFF